MRTPTSEPASLAQELAAAYLPVVRGFLLAAGLYYGVIAAAHPFYETGATLLVLDSLAVVSAVVALSLWKALKPSKTGMPALEAATLVFSALMIANVAAYLSFHFEPLKLVYFVLLALAFGAAAPSLRVAVVSVIAASAGLVYFAAEAPGDLIGQYAFVGLAGAFTAIGMTWLMRGVIGREVKARLAGDALNRRLGDELRRNQQLTRRAESLAVEAQSASRAKSEFLATISHEIRTPLNGVIGMAQIMDQAPLEATQRERLGIVQASALSLLEILNDVLDVSKIEAGRLVLHPAPFDLDAVMAEIEGLYAGLARGKGLSLSSKVEPGAGGWRLGDEGRLRQVLANLVSNAVKFTERGEVEIAVGTDEHGRLRFAVTDSGAGIPAENQRHIFEKFYQADGSATRRQGGTGLGLTICRELVSMMSGELAFESAEGQGSRFWFSLPLAPAEPPAAAVQSPEIPNAAETGVRVLVVDDNPTNRLILRELLTHLGVQTTMAHDGVEAVEAWRTSAWDAILMDVQMPNMDGLEATRIIRSAEAETGRPRTPIIAVTASVLAHETNRYSQAGMDDLVAKPIATENLLAVLERCLAGGDKQAAAA